MTEKEEEETKTATATFFREIFLSGQELEFPPRFKVFTNDDYMLEGGNTALSLTVGFEGKFPLGICNTENERTVHFPEGETRGRLRNT